MKKIIFLALASAILTLGLSAQAADQAPVGITHHSHHKIGQMAKHHKKHHKKHHVA